MVDKKQYYALDEIGLVGTQKKLSPRKKKQLERITADFIKAEKAKAQSVKGKAKKRA